MNFPGKEADALLAWMKEQMYGPQATEYRNGNEYDRMKEAADFIGSLVMREAEKYTVEFCPWCEAEVVIHSKGITACPTCGMPLAPCSVCHGENIGCIEPCPYGCTGGAEDEHKTVTEPPITQAEIDFAIAHC
jgi:hypothetical protein